MPGKNTVPLEPQIEVLSRESDLESVSPKTRPLAQSSVTPRPSCFLTLLLSNRKSTTESEMNPTLPASTTKSSRASSKTEKGSRASSATEKRSRASSKSEKAKRLIKAEKKAMEDMLEAVQREK